MIHISPLLKTVCSVYPKNPEHFIFSWGYDNCVDAFDLKINKKFYLSDTGMQV